MDTVAKNAAELKPSTAGAIGAAGSNGASRDKLLSDLKTVVADVDHYLRATAGEASEGTGRARARLEATLGSVKERLAEGKRELVGKARTAAQATDDYVHENPWRSIAIIAGAGLIAGLLIGRR
jgi:ElaB/YqjD/DUF883 family membrane-anchored ribosome-binding protein